MPITVASRRNLAARALDPCSTTILELSPSMGVLHHALDLLNLRASLPLALPLLILQLTSLMAASDRRFDCRADCRF
jgi:hypothetical protein